VTVRGRFITGPASWTSDFVVSQVGGAPSTFVPTGWLGHYHTAHGYAAPGRLKTEYHYYPMWTVPGGKARYAHVRFLAAGTGKAGLQARPVVDNQLRKPYLRLIPARKVDLTKPRRDRDTMPDRSDG
jgi:hypothetical protein